METNTAAGGEVLDQQVIGQYQACNSALIPILVDAFLEESQKYFQDMRGAFDSNDLTKASLAAHGLKSCSLNLGAVRLAEICAKIELKGREKDDFHGVKELFEDVGPVLFETEEALKAIKMSSASEANL